MHANSVWCPMKVSYDRKVEGNKQRVSIFNLFYIVKFSKHMH